MPDTFHAGPNLGKLSDVTVIHGDCIDAMAELAADSIDAIVTDPPYGLGFMGRAWDDLPPGLDWAKQCLRVLKPGGHLLAFGGTRTWHRLAVSIEDAGFEIRDSIAWLYGSGFPKSLDVSKAIDKAAGAERPTYARAAFGGAFSDDNGTTYGTAIDGHPITPEADQWSGWGTALKPAFEPIIVARKPLAAGTVAANVLTHGTGALNIDACRIESTDSQLAEKYASIQNAGSRANTIYGSDARDRSGSAPHAAGRWPANVVLDADQAAALDEQSGTLTSGEHRQNYGTVGRTGMFGNEYQGKDRAPDSGGASRFFYCAKAPKKERPVIIDAASKSHSHPTVKPLALMRWLARLVTPPGGKILDPFAGSGTMVEAALLEGFQIVAIERGGPEGTPEFYYLPMIQQRIARTVNA